MAYAPVSSPHRTCRRAARGAAPPPGGPRRHDVAEVDVGSQLADQPGLLVLAGCLEHQFSTPTRRRRPRPPVRTSPSGSNSPTVPLSRPSVTTQVAPAARSPGRLLRPLGGRDRDRGSFGPTSLSTTNRAAAAPMRARFGGRVIRTDPGGHLDAGEPDAGRPVQVLLHDALVPGDLEQRAAGAGEHAVLGEQRELLRQPGVEIRRAPPELPHVHVRPAHAEHRGDLGHRQALVEHMGDPAAAGLVAALGQREKAGHGIHHDRNPLVRQWRRRRWRWPSWWRSPSGCGPAGGPREGRHRARGRRVRWRRLVRRPGRRRRRAARGRRPGRGRRRGDAAGFVAADPYGAGVSAVLANVNDLAAMGA